MTRNYSVTIGIPYYNRATLVIRCLDSIQRANRSDRISVIIFDDGSQEKLKIEKEYDFRLQVIRSEKNVGVCEGRRALLAASETELFMILDSDDTVPENYLEIIDSVFDAKTDGILFQCLWDDGSTSPAIPFPAGNLTLPRLLKFIDSNPTHRLEWRSVVKTITREQVTWPPGHRKMERYHYDLVANYRIRGVNKVIRNYHSDASDQISKTGSHGDNSYVVSRDRALGVVELLLDYGVVLKKYSPKRFIHQFLFLLNHLSILKVENKLEYNHFKEIYPQYFTWQLSLLAKCVFYINKVRRKSRSVWPI